MEIQLPMFVLAIDPSPRATGWALLAYEKGTTPVLKYCGWVPTKTGTPSYEVSRLVYNAVREPLQLAHLIGIEQPLFFGHGNRYYQQAEMIGGITGRMPQGVYAKVHWIQPSQAKVCAGAETKGKNSKKEVIHGVEKVVGKIPAKTQPEREAIADACAIGFATHLLYAKPE